MQPLVFKGNPAYALTAAEKAKLLQAGVIAYREPVVLSEAKKARVERLRAYWKERKSPI